jgi:hypothetical protein
MSDSLKFMRRIDRLQIEIFAIALLVQLTSAAPAPAQSLPAKSPLQKIVMIGASVSAGFTASEPFGGTNTQFFRLNRYLDAALATQHEPIQNYAHSFFFLQPEAQGRQQIERAVKAQPTLVVGIDFLFWFLYGEGFTEQQRLQRLEKGLKLLELVQCSLVIGDIPDASGASEEMLSKESIPNVKTLLAANQRLKDWSTKRRDVAVVPLSDFMRTVMANDALKVHNQVWPRGKTLALLQADKLHPSPSGCTALTLAIAGALVKQPNISTNQFRWNAQEIFQSVVQSSKVSRK